MSNNNGGWETIGKSSKKSSSSKQQKSKTSTQSTAQQPKLEDVFPLKQINSCYANAYEIPTITNGEKKKPAPNNNKPAKPATTTAKQKPKVEPLPSDLKEAVTKIDAETLNTILTTARTRFPDNRLLWLRDIASYLNQCLKTAQKEPEILETLQFFSGKTFSSVKREAKKPIVAVLAECTDGTRESVFENFTVNIAREFAANNNNNNKGSCVAINGYLFLIWLMTEAYPSLALCNMKRFVELRNSYQNRVSCCATLIWCLGQGGRKDLLVGLKVWLEFMVPLLKLQSYQEMCVRYLSELLGHHKTPQRRILFSTQFFQFFHAFYVIAPTMRDKNSQALLMKQYPAIKALSIGDGSYDHELFPNFFRMLSNRESLMSDAEKDEILSNLERILINSPQASLSHWQQMYITYLKPSQLLLERLAANWKMFAKNAATKEDLNQTILVFQKYNLEHRNTKGISQNFDSCRILRDKMSNKSGGWFPWKTSCLLLLLGISILIKGDLDKHPDFKVTRTGKFLRDSGLYEPGLRAFNSANKLWSDFDMPARVKYAKKQADPAYTALKLHCENAKVYVVDKMEEYGPGISAKVVVAKEELYRGYAFVLKNAPLWYNGAVVYTTNCLQSTKRGIDDLINGKTDFAKVSAFSREQFEKMMNRGNSVYLWIVDSVRAASK